MRLTITEGEWLQALSNARDVAAALGSESSAALVARAALEAVGITVPVIDAELEVATGGTARRATPVPSPSAPQSSSVATQAAPPDEPPDTPRKDLRRAARVTVDTDGYCPHCDTIYGAAALAVMDDGNRLCPVHGTVVREVAEVSEGRFTVARLPGQPRPRGAARAQGVQLCEAPIGGHPCAEPVGHTGRHRPRPSATGSARRDGLDA